MIGSAAGCARSGDPAPIDASVPIVLPLTPSSAPSSPPVAVSPASLVARELCAADTSCALVSLRSIGQRDGGDRYVALLHRGSGDRQPDVASSHAELGLDTEGNTDTFEVGFDRCSEFEYWLAAIDGDRLVRPQLTLIPAIETPAGFATDGWKAVASIDACSARIDTLSALISDGHLFVEIADDRLVDNGKLRDELEIWHQSAPSADFMSHCMEAPKPASGTTVRLGDLSTRLIGAKTGAALRVERAAVTGAGSKVRLKVQLPPKTGAFTVVYRDTDDGRTWSQVIASSRFDPSDSATLGTPFTIHEERATCVLSHDALVMRQKPPANPNAAAID